MLLGLTTPLIKLFLAESHVIFNNLHKLPGDLPLIFGPPHMRVFSQFDLHPIPDPIFMRI